MGMFSRSTRHAFFVLVSFAFCGCQFVPKAQLTALQEKHRNLLEQNKSQMAQIQNLQQTLQADRGEVPADKSMASSVGKPGAASRANGLKWGSLGNSPSPTQRRKMAALSKKYKWLHYDDASGVCRVDDEMLFTSGSAQLDGEAKKLVQELADLMVSEEGGDLRILAVGHTDQKKIGKKDTRSQFDDNWELSTARALAVASELQREGVAEGRVAIAAMSGHQPIAPNKSAADRVRNRRVELFLISPETPVVGWTETSPGLY